MSLNSGIFSVEGKLALITGSSRGLGLAYAEGYLDVGARVVLNGRSQTALDAAVEKLRDKRGEVFTRAFDVTNAEAAETAIERIEAEIGAVDILINNAGIQHRQKLLDIEPGDWRSVIDTNLTSAFLVGRAAAKRMIKRGKGKIINITSLNAEMARAGISPYCAAKGGLTMLTKSMATEWGEFGINCNAIGPGYFETEMTAALVSDPNFDAWVKSEVPMRRWGKPEELIGAAIFLGSAASDYVNGITVYVDGGWRASL